MSDLVQDVADVIYRVECNWDREGSGPGSRFEGECREHAQARGVLHHLAALGLIPASCAPLGPWAADRSAGTEDP